MNRTVGCIDPSIRNSCLVSVYIIAVHSFMRVESRSSACFSDSPLARMITGLIKVLRFGCSSLFTGDIISCVLKCQVVCLLYLVSVLVLYLLFAC